MSSCVFHRCYLFAPTQTTDFLQNKLSSLLGRTLCVFLKDFSPIAETHSDFLIISAMSSDGREFFSVGGCTHLNSPSPCCRSVWGSSASLSFAGEWSWGLWCFWSSSQIKQNAPAAFFFLINLTLLCLLDDGIAGNLFQKGFILGICCSPDSWCCTS